MRHIKLNNIAILNIGDVDCCIAIRRCKAINLLKNTDLSTKKKKKKKTHYHLYHHPKRDMFSALDKQNSFKWASWVGVLHTPSSSGYEPECKHCLMFLEKVFNISFIFIFERCW